MHRQSSYFTQVEKCKLLKQQKKGKSRLKLVKWFLSFKNKFYSIYNNDILS